MADNFKNIEESDSNLAYKALDGLIKRGTSLRENKNPEIEGVFGPEIVNESDFYEWKTSSEHLLTAFVEDNAFSKNFEKRVVSPTAREVDAGLGILRGVQNSIHSNIFSFGKKSFNESKGQNIVPHNVLINTGRDMINPIINNNSVLRSEYNKINNKKVKKDWNETWWGQCLIGLVILLSGGFLLYKFGLK